MKKEKNLFSKTSINWKWGSNEKNSQVLIK